MPRASFLVPVIIAIVLCLTILEFSGKTQVTQTVVDTVNERLPLKATNSAQYCKWEFSHYEPSEYEFAWLSRVQISQEGLCHVLTESAEQTASKAIVGRALELKAVNSSLTWASVDSGLLTEVDQRDVLMSRMYYRRSCYNPATKSFVKQIKGLGVQLIEPLWGTLRDPYDITCGEDTRKMDGWYDLAGQSKNHIMPQGFAPYAYSDDATDSSQLHNWRDHGQPPWVKTLRPVTDREVGVTFAQPRTIHIDFGSSYFEAWQGHANAASGRWFYDHYHQRGLTFDQFIAVELESLDPNVAFKQIPTDLVGKYTLMNIGLTMDTNDKLHALDMISRVVQPNDFLVFKLDIDSAPIEDPIVQSLLNDDPEAGGESALIDELMFEHHVKFDPMSEWWGLKNADDSKVGHLVDSYNLFQGLRRKGIRAHSWP